LGNIPYAPRPPPPPPAPAPIQPNETYNAPPGFSSVPGLIYPFISSTPTVTSSPSPISTPFPLSPAGGAPGGNPSLYDVLYNATVTVMNSGNLPGKEVVQLYVSYPDSVGEPPRQLRGFEKISLDVGESTMVNFDLLRKDLSYWDVVSQNWVIANGTYGIYVGSSSRDLRLQQTINVG
jgi:beta-glucosidase